MSRPRAHGVDPAHAAAAADPAQAGGGLGRPHVRDPAAVRARGRARSPSSGCRSSFNNDLRATAADLQEQLRVQRDLRASRSSAWSRSTLRAAAAGGAAIRVVDRGGSVIRQTAGPRPTWARPWRAACATSGDFRVVARPLFAGSLDRSGSFNLDRRRPIDGAVAFVQYAKPRREPAGHASAALHLFLALGVLGGTGLAFLAGFAVARRAMRPIAGLTRAAREVARTRDPGHVAAQAARPTTRWRAGRHARGHAPRARRRARRDRGRARAPARVRGRRLARAAHAADQHPRQPRAARGRARRRPAGPRDREAAAEIAGSALRSSRRMRRLVGDLLLLARADAGRQAPRAPGGPGRRSSRDAAREAAPLASGHDVSLDLPPTARRRRGRGLGRRPAPAGAQPGRERADPHAARHAGRGLGAPRRRRRWCSRWPTAAPACPPELRERVFERFARRGRRHRRRAAGWAWRSCAPWRRPTADRWTVREAEGGGAVFARHPAGAAPLRSPAERVRGSETGTATDPKGGRDHVKRSRPPPSPALVIACLALFVSLGGVSYGVATGFIDSRELRDNTIRTQDLRNNDIRGIDIRNSTDPAAATWRINTLTGVDINESTLGQGARRRRRSTAWARGGLRARRTRGLRAAAARPPAGAGAEPRRRRLRRRPARLRAPARAPRSASGPGAPLLTLPAGARPAADSRFMVWRRHRRRSRQGDVEPDGTVHAVTTLATGDRSRWTASPSAPATRP